MIRYMGRIVVFSLTIVFLSMLVDRAFADNQSIQSKNIVIELNHGKVIHLDKPAKTVFIANPEIADFHVKAPGVLYLFSKKIGETSLYALDDGGNEIANYQITVSPNLTQLKKTLSNMFPEQDLSADVVGDSVVLRGNVASIHQAEDIRRIANQFVPNNNKVLNFTKTESPAQVNLRVRVVEMSREISRDIGMNYLINGKSGNDSIGISALFPSKSLGDVPNFLLNTVVDTGFLDITATIDLLDKEGLITILSEPNLTALSGETARFLAGGEFPIVVPQGQDVYTVEFKEFGVRLAFTPTLMGQDKINLQVRPEVSELSDKGAIEINGFKVPGLVTRRAETVVELNSGQSFVIAGLLQNNANQTVSKFPGLADIPVMGRLFQSEQFVRGESELVIIVTPYIVQPIDGRQAALPTSELRLANEMAIKSKAGFVLN